VLFVILKIAVIFVFAGLVIFILSLRAFQKQDFLAIERLIDGLSARVQKQKSDHALTLWIVSLLQSLGCLLLANKKRSKKEDWPTQKAEVEAVVEFIESALAKTGSVAPMVEALLSLQKLRDQAFEAYLKSESLLEFSAESTLAGRDFTADSLVEPVLKQILKPLPENWDENAWSHIEKGAMRIGNLRWAFSDNRLLELDLRLLLDRSILVYQGMGPSYALVRQLLEAGDRDRLDKALEGWTLAFGQCFFLAQTTLRLSRLASSDEGRRAERGDQSRRCFETIEKTQLDFFNWIQQVELQFIKACYSQPDNCLLELLDAFEDLGQRLAVQSGQLAHTIGDSVSENWRVQEMIYGHPRGQDIVDQFKLQCHGCHLAETESLTSASMVHNFSVETVLKALTEKR
jgi:hypothetical protein